MMLARTIGLAVLSLLASGLTAQAQNMHAGHSGGACSEVSIVCAPRVTPTFDAAGRLWAIWETHDRVWVSRSEDLGRSFGSPIAVTPQAVAIDWGPDARPKIVVTPEGRVVATYSIFRDKRYNGEVFVSYAADGTAFSAPSPITDVQESQRFEALALAPDGRVFAAWLDKRNRVPAAQRGETYVGTALMYAWLDPGHTTTGATEFVFDNTCECCRLGLTLNAEGQPVIAFRNVFAGSIRDHAVTTFENGRPGPLRRVAVDNWRTDACPHQGPSLTLSEVGTYHVVWFTAGQARKGIFYARSEDQGRTFSEPMPLTEAKGASRPFVASIGSRVWMVWKDFDGQKASIRLRLSDDDGKTWSSPRVVAETSGDSDHPLLLSRASRMYLSWQTEQDGYSLRELGAGL